MAAVPGICATWRLSVLSAGSRKTRTHNPRIWQRTRESLHDPIKRTNQRVSVHLYTPSSIQTTHPWHRGRHHHACKMKLPYNSKSSRGTFPNQPRIEVDWFSNSNGASTYLHNANAESRRISTTQLPVCQNSYIEQMLVVETTGHLCETAHVIKTQQLKRYFRIWPKTLKKDDLKIHFSLAVLRLQLDGKSTQVILTSTPFASSRHTRTMLP